MTIGIYRIFLPDGRSYIGQSCNVERRLREHRNNLNRGATKSPKLQSAWTKYGEAAFAFEVLETCDSDELTTREQWWMDNLGLPLLNTAPAAGSTRGLRQTEEQRKRRSETMRGKPQQRGYKISPEGRANIRIAHLGYKASDEQRSKISASLTGRAVSDATKAKIAVSLKKRYALGLPTGRRAKD